MTGTTTNNNFVTQSFTVTEEIGMPTSVRVGPFELNISVLPDIDKDTTDSMLFGYFSLAEETIFIRKGSVNIMADTLLHEILHAIWALTGGWTASELTEEKVISMMTSTLLDTLKRNDSLTRFLLQR